MPACWIRPAPVEEPGAHGAHLRAQGLAGHQGQPVGSERLDVVVDEDQQSAAGAGRRGVVHGGEVERPGTGYDQPPPLPLQAAQEVQGLLLATVVVADQDLERGPVGAGSQAVEAGAEQVEPVAGRDDDAGEGRRIGDRVFDPHEPVRRDDEAGLGASDPVEVAAHDLAVPLPPSRPFRRASVGRPRAPDRQDLRKVADRVRAVPLGDAQGGLGRTDRTGLRVEGAAPKGQDGAEIVEGREPVGVEDRRQQRQSRTARPVLHQRVAVHGVEIGIGREGRGDPLGGAFDENAVADHPDVASRPVGGRRVAVETARRKGEPVIDPDECRALLAGAPPLAGQPRPEDVSGLPRPAHDLTRRLDQPAPGSPRGAEIQAAARARSGRHSRSSPNVVSDRAGW